MSGYPTFFNDASTTLNGAINNSQTTLVVTSTSGFPTVPDGEFVIRIDDEIMLVTASGSTTWTVTREWDFGQNISAVASHANGATVYLVLSSALLQEALLKRGAPVPDESGNSVLTGSTDTSGLPNALSIGTGLRLNLTANNPTGGLAATEAPFVYHTAGGYETAGGALAVNALPGRSSILFNITDVIAADIGPNNTSYIHAAGIFSAAVSPGSGLFTATLAPTLYGYKYDRTAMALLHFEGTNGATTTLDDNGNTWTMTASTIQTAQFKFGASSINFNGTTAYISTTDIKTLGFGSWSMSGFVRWNTLPTAATTQTLISATNASGFGVYLGLNNTTGTTKTTLSLSSNGTSANLVSAQLGTKTAWATATWYHFAVTFDALAGKYFVYIDGVLDQTVTTTSKISAITTLRLGAGITPNNFLNGWIDEFVYRQYCAFPNGTTFTPLGSAYDVSAGLGSTLDNGILTTLSSPWYSIGKGKLFFPSGPSVSAGTDPPLQASSYTPVAEADTSAAAVTAVRNYAFRGRYESDWDTSLPGLSATKTFNHNLGVVPRRSGIILQCRTADQGYVPGDEVHFPNTTNTTYATPFAIKVSRNSMTIATQQSTAFATPAPAGGLNIALVSANWAIRAWAERGF